MLTPTLRFKANMFPNTGMLPSRTSDFPRRGGFQFASIPGDIGPVSGSGGNAGNNNFVRYYLQDGILVELQWSPDGRRCLRAVQSLASEYFRLLGERGVSDPLLMSARKITDWEPKLEGLGWIIDTEALTVTLPSHERLKLQKSPCGVALVSYICFSEAGVAARWLPYTCLLCCASGAVFREPFVGFGGYAAHTNH